MTALLAMVLDRDVAGHLAVALRRHREVLKKRGRGEPDGLAQLETLALEVVSSNQQASASGTVGIRPDDGLHDRDFLSRTDVSRLTGASLATVDRWIARGELASCKHGRTRRIARADLNRFLAA